MSEQLTQRELNWIEGWIDALDADTYAAEILRKMVAALQSAPPASEPEYEHLGDYSAVEPWHRVFMSCDRCKVTWDGCWDNYQCPRCGEGDLPWRGDFLAPADRPYGDIPDEDIDLLYDNKWSLYDSDESADRPECSVCNDAPTTPFCSSCGQRPTQSDRPEPPLREGAMRAAEGCDSPHPDGDRPEPSEALGICNRIACTVIGEHEDTGEPVHIGDICGEHLEYIRRHLSQPAPAVPSAVRRLPEYWRMVASNLRSRDRYAVAEGYHSSADDLERALAAQPSESPAVLEGRWGENTPEVLADSQWIAGAKFGWNCGVSGDRVKLHRAIESRVQDRADAAAPTPTDDGDKNEM